MGAPEKQVGEFTCPDFTEDPEPALRTKCQELAPCVIHRSRWQEPTGIWDRACLTSTCTLLYKSDSALFCFIDLHFAKPYQNRTRPRVFRHSLSNKLIQGVQVRANLPPHRSRAQANTSLQVACVNGTAPEAIFTALHMLLGRGCFPIPYRAAKTSLHTWRLQKKIIPSEQVWRCCCHQAATNLAKVPDL